MTKIRILTWEKREGNITTDLTVTIMLLITILITPPYVYVVRGYIKIILFIKRRDDILLRAD